MVSSVENYEAWCRRVAIAMRPGSPHQDDLAQEGMIEIWRLMEKGHTNAVYLTTSAKWRMLEVLTGDRQAFGGDPKPGPRYRPQTVAVDWQDPGVLEALDQGAPAETDLPEVRAAVVSLPERDREIVYDRFWRDNPWPSKVESSRWSKYIRPRLETRLAEVR